ncbi:hypothetical protein [Aquimonas voraii]|uniref:MSHA biogenesis protein MshQ n=1 Tax=Aquimonas voraii TaxID=265719 RepID=A0A1G6ZDR5_9GAMM|nr:hypothetical protein [Aquimonas voraii]SDE00779.1 hypothetical protein SAMN04488509_11375 [Aquimonas voraii]
MRLLPIPFFMSVLFGVSAPTFAVESPTLTFRGSEHPPIPLNPADSVQVAPDGSVQATCVFQEANPTRCVNVGTQVSGQVPQVSFTTNLSFVQDSTTVYAATSGQQFTITRSVTGTADVCLPSVSGATATVQGWTSVPAGSGTSNVSISATVPAGETRDVTLGLRCYNAFGAPETFQRTFRLSAPAGPNPGACTLPSNPLIRPQGFTEHVRTWAQIFNGFNYPQTPSFQMPVGSYSVTRDSSTSPPSAGMYLAVPITLPDNAFLRLTTYQATGRFAINYFEPRAGNVFFSLSPCAGDLRPFSATGADVFQRCSRGLLFEGSITFSTQSAAGACRLPAGDYWLNIIHANPAATGFSDPAIAPTLNSCNGGLTRCESNVTVAHGGIVQ